MTSRSIKGNADGLFCFSIIYSCVSSKVRKLKTSCLIGNKKRLIYISVGKE